MFTKYGYTTIGIVTTISVIIFFLGLFQNNGVIKIALILLSLILLIFTFSFFRDPDRSSPGKDNLVVSPADGRVLFVKEVDDNKYIKEKAKQISIFMSPFNVHVNRIPIDGKVEYLKYHQGKYLAAFEDKACCIKKIRVWRIKHKYGRVFFTHGAVY